MSKPLGQLRTCPVQCTARPRDRRCRAITRNPNAICTSHQCYACVPRFTWVDEPALEVEKEQDFDMQHLTSDYEYEIAMVQYCSTRGLLLVFA